MVAWAVARALCDRDVYQVNPGVGAFATACSPLQFRSRLEQRGSERNGDCRRASRDRCYRGVKGWDHEGDEGRPAAGEDGDA